MILVRLQVRGSLRFNPQGHRSAGPKSPVCFWSGLVRRDCACSNAVQSVAIRHKRVYHCDRSCNRVLYNNSTKYLTNNIYKPTKNKTVQLLSTTTTEPCVLLPSSLWHLDTDRVKPLTTTVTADHAHIFRLSAWAKHFDRYCTEWLLLSFMSNSTRECRDWVLHQALQQVITHQMLHI